MYIAQAISEGIVKVLPSPFSFTENRVVSHIIYHDYVFHHPTLSSYYALHLLSRSATCLYLMRK